MYTTKQQKPQLSRLIQCLLNKKTLNDTSLQLRCGIFAQNKLFPKKDPVYGESGNYKPDDYDDLSEVFGNVQPKKFRYSNGRGYYERKPYFCAEPKALCNLWKRDKKDLDGTKTAKEKWLKNVSFPHHAYNYDISRYLYPCGVCSQWITKYTPMRLKV